MSKGNNSLSLIFNCNLFSNQCSVMFSNQCHYCEKDKTFILHSSKNIWIEQNRKELFILTKSCPFFLDFLSSIGNSRVPPNSRSVQIKEQDNNKKSVLKSKQAVNEAVISLSHSVLFSKTVSLHDGFSSQVL